MRFGFATIVGIIIFLMVGLVACLWPSLTRADQPKETVPGWANFFTLNDYREFTNQVRSYFADEGVEVGIDNGIVKKKLPGETGGLGLQNLAQSCNLAPHGEWKKMIASYFDSSAQADKQGRELAEKAKSFSQISGLLAVKIWPSDYLKQRGAEELVYREDIEGTISALVFDLPSAIRSVNPEQVTSWGKTKEELFALGLENVRKKTHVVVSEEALGDGLKCFGLTSEDFYTASHALLLDQYPQCLGKYGTLVGIPTRHIVVCCPIDDASAVRVVQKLIPIIVGLEKEGSGSISSQLFWRHDGKFTRLLYKLTDKRLDFMPPDEFVDMMNKLPIPPEKK